VRDWCARGIPSPHGKQWSAHSLRVLLANPRLAGWLTYHGEIVGRAPWPAILDDTTSAELRLKLADPSRTRDFTARAPTYLLTGFLRCGKCGGRMCTRPVRHGLGRNYVCFLSAPE
jgi:site-specific DNA recombinase